MLDRRQSPADRSGSQLLRQLAGTLALTLAVLPNAALAELGTCITQAGAVLAPWSDAFDPACGADCGPDGWPGSLALPWVDTAMSLPAEGCDEEAPGCAAAELPPEPPGPRCLEPGPACGSDLPPPGEFRVELPPFSPTQATVPLRRPSGSLPGPAAEWRRSHLTSRSPEPLEPPPRDRPVPPFNP